MEAKRNNIHIHWSEQSERYLEVVEACNARIERIRTNFKQRKQEIYWERNKEFLESKWNPLKIIRAHRKSVNNLTLLCEKTEKELEEEKRRRKELEQMYW